jgi:hypothetical protein
VTRIAESILTLADDVWARSPNTTIYFYDNDTAKNSDHDPNDYGVICACDIMAGHGLDLGELAQEIVDARHPECAYVIYNRRIASRNTNWKWVEYTGPNPHTDHIHVSVGTGRDAHKKPPYDSKQHWLEDAMGDIFCKKGDVNDAVKNLKIGLNRIWRGRPDYNGKDLLPVNQTYDKATCDAVHLLLGGPPEGTPFHPELYWRLMDKHAALYAGKPGPEGPQGVKGDPGTSAVLAPGDVLEIRSTQA